MRVVQIGKYSREYAGGVERAFFALSERLAREVEVEAVVCAARGPGRVERGESLACRVLPRWFSLASAPIYPALIPFLKGLKDCDVVQISYQNPMAALAYLAARPRGKLVVWYHHDVVRHRALGALIEPLLSGVLRRADAIVATSEAYARGSAALRPFASKVRVIPLGIDPGPLEDEREAAAAGAVRERYGSPLVLFVGRLVYYKGLPYLIEAMKGLDANLLIVGDGPMEADLRARARELGGASRVHFLKVPAAEPLGRYFHACDLLALPSTERTEAFGLVLLEAMACAKPVVATELGTGTSFVCRDGETGRVVPPRDAAALRAAMAGLLSDPAASSRMGEAGRRRLRAVFTARAMAESFLALYRELLGRS